MISIASLQAEWASRFCVGVLVDAGLVAAEVDRHAVGDAWSSAVRTRSREVMAAAASRP